MASLRQTVMYELNLKFRESMRSRYASAASTGETFFSRINAESSATDKKGISVLNITPSEFWFYPMLEITLLTGLLPRDSS